MAVLDAVAPRIIHVPEYVESRGIEAIELGKSVGLIADPHQELVLIHAQGVKADGKWAAFEVGVCEPRQNGKGGMLELRELAGLFLWGEKLLIHSAHMFDTSAEHFYRMAELIEEADLMRQVKRIVRGHGEEGFVLKNGARLRFRTRTKGGGRGFSCDFLALDEGYEITTASHGALLPTMRARPNPQIWYTGSAVDQQVHEHGVVFASVRERGIEGKDQSLAYFEWSIDEENPAAVTPEMAADRENWRRSNPALGIRIFEEHMLKELNSMDTRTFAVELLGVGDWPRTDGHHMNPISNEEWAELKDPTSHISSDVCLAFDVSPERRTSIAAAGYRPDGLYHVEVIAQWPGTGWLVQRLLELVEEHEPVEVVCDAYGPAASMMPKIIEAGVQLTPMSSNEHAEACGLLADVVTQRTLRHLGSSELTNAVRGAATRPLGDRWAWSRKSSAVDISPLVASTLALWSASRHPDDDDDPVIY